MEYNVLLKHRLSRVKGCPSTTLTAMFNPNIQNIASPSNRINITRLPLISLLTIL